MPGVEGDQPLAVLGLQAGEDGGVGVGDLDAVGVLQGGEVGGAVGRGTVPDALGLRHHEVEGRQVEDGEGDDPNRLERAVAVGASDPVDDGVHGGADRLELVGVGPADAPEHLGLEDPADLVDLRHLERVDPGDEVAPMGVVGEELLGPEHLQGLPGRGAAHPDLGGPGALADVLAREELAATDGAADLGPDPLGGVGRLSVDAFTHGALLWDVRGRASSADRTPDPPWRPPAVRPRTVGRLVAPLIPAR